MKNIYCQLILHIALLLPMTTLGSQPTKNWYEKIYSYMPQAPNLPEWASNYALFLALAALGYALYSQYPYSMSPINEQDAYAPENLNNFAIFLSCAESNNFSRIQPKLADTELFEQYICPILVKLAEQLPQQPALPDLFDYTSSVTFWRKLIRTVQLENPQKINLSQPWSEYLRILNRYISLCDDETLSASFKLLSIED